MRREAVFDDGAVGDGRGVDCDAALSDGLALLSGRWGVGGAGIEEGGSGGCCGELGVSLVQDRGAMRWWGVGWVRCVSLRNVGGGQTGREESVSADGEEVEEEVGGDEVECTA